MEAGAFIIGAIMGGLATHFLLPHVMVLIAKARGNHNND